MEISTPPAYEVKERITRENEIFSKLRRNAGHPGQFPHTSSSTVEKGVHPLNNWTIVSSGPKTLLMEIKSVVSVFPTYTVNAVAFHDCWLLPLLSSGAGAFSWNTLVVWHHKMHTRGIFYLTKQLELFTGYSSPNVQDQPEVIDMQNAVRSSCEVQERVRGCRDLIILCVL